MAWLDALRGFAALCVVFHHLNYHVLQSVRGPIYDVFNPGLYGVLVFFLVSGFLVPALLERKGSIRTFWISRIFRLFPLFAVALAAFFVLHPLGYTRFIIDARHPAATVLAHMFMLNDLLAVNNLIDVLWTLSYEMVFYLLLTALFTVGLHRHSGRIALVFAAGALALGGILPSAWLSRSLGLANVALVGDVLIIGGIAVAVACRRLPRTVGAVLAAATGLILVALNERVHAYEGLTILAMMFTGTLLYRAERGAIRRRRAVLLALAVLVLTTVAGILGLVHAGPGQVVVREQRQWIVTLLFAVLTFSAGLALRNRRIPSVLAWLGLVSYSIYLLHPVLLSLYLHTPWTSAPHPIGVQILLFLAFMAVLLPCCALTYYSVEAPMQRLGHRLARWLDTRFGPDRQPAAQSTARERDRVLAG